MKQETVLKVTKTAASVAGTTAFVLANVAGSVFKSVKAGWQYSQRENQKDGQ